MPVKCAIGAAVTTITRTITVAAGAFAPGHLGELTRIVPFEMADAVLDEAPGARERRVRLLPSRAGLYFLLAMCLFPQAGYLGVWGKLTAALDGLGLAVPSPKALRDLRRRIGIAPVRRLFEILAGPQGQPRTPGVMSGGYRTVSCDGCKSVKVPDTVANRAWLGKQNASNGETGYPALCLMPLVETGTRALLGAVFGTTATGELDWARKLLNLLDESMMVLMDRGFDAGEFLAEAVGTQAQFLVRPNASRRPPVLSHLPDGSFTSLIGGVKVRIIAASVTVTRPRRHHLRRRVPAGDDPAGLPRLPRGRPDGAVPRKMGATRSRLERVELAEGGPADAGYVVPGPVCTDCSRPGVRRG